MKAVRVNPRIIIWPNNHYDEDWGRECQRQRVMLERVLHLLHLEDYPDIQGGHIDFDIVYRCENCGRIQDSATKIHPCPVCEKEVCDWCGYSMRDDDGFYCEEHKEAK